MDEICKAYNQAVQCLHVDAGTQQMTCDHINTAYSYNNTRLSDMTIDDMEAAIENKPLHEYIVNQEIQNMCTVENEAALCETLLCSIESRFVRSIWHFLIEGHTERFS